MSDNKSTKNNFIRHLITFFYIILSLFFIGIGILYSYLKDPNFSIWLWLLFLIPILIHWIGLFFAHLEAVTRLDILINQETVLKKNVEKAKNNPTLSNADKIKLEMDQTLYEEQKKEQEGMIQFCYFYNFTKLISVFLYCAGWVSYSGWRGSQWSIESFSVLDIFSYLCLGGIFLQFLIVAFVTYIFMENTQKFLSFDISLLKKGFSLFPFWRFAHFFAIFMSIAFLFGFAFAFHDLSYRKVQQTDSSHREENTFQKTALYLENLPSPDDDQSKKNEKESSIDPAKNQREFTENLTPFCFYFESGKAKLNAEDRGEDRKKNSLTLEQRIRLAREDENNKNFNELLSQIEQNKFQGNPRFTLIGRADDKKVGDLYPSNYNLSEARTQVMRSEITNKLYKNNKEWQNIDWILVPYSNEDTKDVISRCKNLESDKDSGKRVVEVYLSTVFQDKETRQIKNFQMKEVQKDKYKTPNLMDYMYFSIYTISTTGYGDIKPATNYSKFLVSLENFFEVFFLVCFMNTLIALKSDPKI